MKNYKIRLFIDSSDSNNQYFCDEDDSTLGIYFNFKTVKDYLEFLAHPFFDSDECVIMTENGYVDFTDVIDYLKDNIHLLVEPIPEVVLNGNEDIFSFVSLGREFIYNIRNLSFEQKVEILTDPRTDDSIKFIDLYTLDDIMSVSDLIFMYDIIYKIASDITVKGYSPVEALYYIYSYLKHFEYKREEENESVSLSRSLVEVLKGNKIVCAGYTNYFKAICDILNIKVEEVTWDSKVKETGHSSIIVYLNDSKYNLCGVFGIDTTWDAKQNGKDYEKTIKHFLVPIVIDDKEKSLRDLNPIGNDVFHNLIHAKSRLENLIKLQAPEVLTSRDRVMVVKKTKKIYELLGLSCDNEESLELLNVVKYGNRLIPLETLKNIIYAVTRNNEDDLDKIIKSSYHYHYSSPDAKLCYELKRMLSC